MLHLKALLIPTRFIIERKISDNKTFSYIHFNFSFVGNLKDKKQVFYQIMWITYLKFMVLMKMINANS